MIIKDPINIISMSDIHLGCRGVSTINILSRLYNTFKHCPEAAHIDFIFLVGDIFDSLQSWPDESVGPIQVFIGYLLRFCKKYDICLRVLEGTPSHDRGQSKEFIIMNEILEINCDVRWVKDIEIEYVERYGVNILYVPDEYRPTTEETKDLVKLAMQNAGLKSVHFTLLHGYYAYQVPDLKDLQVHDHIFYSNITERYGFTGHNHPMSVYENLINHGSFDRLAHNQEHPKGYFKVSSYANRSLDIVQFVENIDATPFITIDISEINFEEGKKVIYKNIEPLLHANIPEINIRLRYKRDSLTDALFNSLNKVYTQITWTKDYVKEVSTVKVGVTVEIYKPVNITKNNITGIIKKRLLCGDSGDRLNKTVLELLHGIK